MRINKLYTPKDPDLNRQIDAIVQGQFLNQKEVSVTFSAINTTVPVRVGFLADRFIKVHDDTGVTIKFISSNNDVMNLQSTSGTGTVKLIVWKS